jgi:plastocyanin
MAAASANGVGQHLNFKERWIEMRPRRRYVPLLVVLGLAAAVLPAIASSETSPTVNAVNTSTGGLYSEEHHSWSPSQVSVGAGGAVTLSNPTTTRHGVKWVGGPTTPTCEGSVPVGTTEAAAGTNWSGSCTFAQAGTYTFYCTVHGPEMTGTVTVSQDGTTTTTTSAPTGAPTTTGTTPGPTTEVPSGPPLVGGPSLRRSQHGTSVHGSLEISPAGAGDRLEVDLLASSLSLGAGGHATRVTVGRLVHSKATVGRQSFSVKLSAQARRALKRRHRLALTVRIVLTPNNGKSTTLTRSVVEHP